MFLYFGGFEEYKSLEKEAEVLQLSSEEMKDAMKDYFPRAIDVEDLQVERFGRVSQLFPSHVGEVKLDNEDICAQILQRQEEIENEINLMLETKKQNQMETNKLEHEWQAKLQSIQRQCEYNLQLIGKHDAYYGNPSANKDRMKSDANNGPVNSSHWNRAETDRAQMSLRTLQKLCNIDKEITLNDRGFVAQMQCENTLYNVCIETRDKKSHQIRNISVETQENSHDFATTLSLDDIISSAIVSQKNKRWSSVFSQSEGKDDDVDADDDGDRVLHDRKDDDLMADKLPIHTSELVHKISNRLHCLPVRTKDLEQFQQFYNCCWEKNSESLMLTLEFAHNVEFLLNTEEKERFGSFVNLCADYMYLLLLLSTYSFFFFLIDKQLNVEVTCILVIPFDYCPEWSHEMIQIQQVEYKFQQSISNESIKEQITNLWTQTCRDIQMVFLQHTLNLFFFSFF
ncbi:hypothetical protein RFI_19085 [Reticulomyxa filosa]|uniref:Uncharacterized protein n=1 Tax=Reticulomyxa filosa TaxID=46433 RepID=X6MYP6_RETFI|nr:hypothetical protein RFI_19085 [Reticulomyxa filosa]|eukprot:ETO18195.1 hypothetical protein RFI_19085 [Reticulomyxa filosa]